MPFVEASAKVGQADSVRVTSVMNYNALCANMGSRRRHCARAVTCGSAALARQVTHPGCTLIRSAPCAPTCATADRASRHGSNGLWFIGEGGIRTRDTGFTQYDGLANRLSQSVTRDAATSYESPDPALTDLLTAFSEKDPDLAAVVSAWLGLPEAVRARIVGLVEGAMARGEQDS